MKRPEEMNAQELMIELLNAQKENARSQKTATFCCLILAAVIAVAACILVPRVITTISNVDKTLIEVNDKLSKVEETFDQVNSAMAEVETTVVQARDSLGEIDVMVGNVNNLVETNTEGLTETVEKINAIDFESLNDSIADLNAVIEPLSRLFGR